MSFLAKMFGSAASPRSTALELSDDESIYRAQREALIAEDRSLRFDHQVKYTAALGANGNTDTLTRADEIIRNLREEEEETVWSKVMDDVPQIFPGMRFLTAKKIIQGTQLFGWMRKMPKGALLHAHMDAMCDAQFLINEAFKHGDMMHVRTPNIISDSSSLKDTLPNFSALPLDRTDGISPVTITHPDYKVGEWVPVNRVRGAFPSDLGGQDGFDKWVLSALRIDPAEAYSRYNSSEKIWTKFGSTFGVARGLLAFEPVLAAYLRELLLFSISDGISYVECRMDFLGKTMVRTNGEDDLSHREWLEIFNKVIEEVREEMKVQGRDDEFVGAKVIYTTLRVISNDELDWYLNDCLTLKKEFPHLVA
ncbi:hypothetical protein FRB93_001409, partial [Tulasnella sp. JGI-2019a]